MPCRGERCGFWDNDACVLDGLDLRGREEVAHWLLDVRRVIDPEAALTFANASVQEAMTTGLIRCTPDAPLRAVAGLMADYRVHAVYVIDEAGTLLGLVSDLDIAAASLGAIDAKTAGAAAVTPLYTVRDDAKLVEAAELMALRNATHLAVVDQMQRPVGVVSTLDVARVIARTAP